MDDRSQRGSILSNDNQGNNEPPHIDVSSTNNNEDTHHDLNDNINIEPRHDRSNGIDCESPNETTSLLSGEPSKKYGNISENGEFGYSSQFNRRPFNIRRHTWNPMRFPAGVFSRPIRRFKQRSGVYDEDKNALIREGGGIRVWYDDYTTIDWIHDYVKERVRVRRLYSIGGIRGYLKTSFDGLQGWVLVFLIGIVTACFAGAVDVAAEWGSDLKDGYCNTDFYSKKSFCCKNSADLEESCANWTTWSQALHFESEEESWWFDYFAYVFVAFCFAVGAAILVKYNSLYASPSSKSSSTISENRPSHKNLRSYAAGSGIPEVKTILSGFVIRGFLGIRTLWVKALTLAMAVSAGLTLGKEGPFVHIACCVGNVLTRLFQKYNKNEGKRREILSASAAAGVSVAFAAPIGGVLFSLEEVSYYFPSKTLVRSFFCAIVAAVTLKLIDPFNTGKIVMFQVSYVNDWHVFEIFSFLILGVLGGLIGALLCRSIVLYSKYVRNRTWLRDWPVVEVILVVTITATVNYLNKYTKISNTDLVHFLFNECKNDSTDLEGLCVTNPEDVGAVFRLLGITLISKFLTCIITFGIRVPAGIFIPALLIGACFGRMLGLVVQWLTLTYPEFPLFSAVCNPYKTNDCIVPGIYAMVGAAASLAGVTRMTVSLTVIMFELTGALTYVLPIMTAIMISKWVADGLVKHGIYDLLIELNGHPYLDSKVEYVTAKSTIELCQRDLEVIDISEPNTIGELKAKLKRLSHSGYSDAGFPIIDGSLLVGYIASTELEHALRHADSYAESTRCRFKETKEIEIEISVDNGNNASKEIDFTVYMDQAPLTVSQNSSLEVVLELFKKLGLRYVCVVDCGQYVGVIHKKRLLAHLREMDVIEGH
ncbi:9168_t:CDS:10 [Acaulospora morrowiae]|uniref:Chloride channel protein n=1 Tax=Acaulospora morrowiae TaxID=94023 RepID=A0A9N8VT28_9GLOM|nr:9168_t:CDS:10 [Acaulospora morrowiae]